MNSAKNKSYNHYIKSSSAIEFLAVFSFLFVFFILILDVGLLFRQIYLVQTIADEVTTKLTIEKQCSSDLYKTAQIANNVISFYFTTREFSYESKNGKAVQLSTDDNKYNFLISCRNEITPDSLIFTYYYKGIIVYRKGRYITSNISVNTTYY